MTTTPRSKPTKVVIPKFKKADTNGFANEIKRRIEDHFAKTGLPKRGGNEIVIKSILLFLIFGGSYFLLLSGWFNPWGIFFSGLIFGITHILIVFNIAHDASHNALFKNRQLNKLLSYCFNLVGTSAYLWNLTHNRIHHTYPNVGEYDTDIQQQAPLIRVSPSVKLKWFHRYQPYYAIILYMIYSLFLVFLKDYQDFRFIPKSDSHLLAIQKHPPKEYIIFFLSKIFYYSYTIVIPFIVIGISWQQFLIGYLAIHVCMGLLLAAVLIPVHLVDEAEFVMVDENGTLADNWTTHVFKSTNDYSRKSKLANYLFGGLNAHIVHHLFPTICHVQYIALSEILKDTAEAYNLKFHDVTMGQAIISHFRLLKRMSK